MAILLQGTYSLSMNPFVMDAATITTSATNTSERLAAEEDSKTGAATLEAEQIEGKRLQCSNCNKKSNERW